jgi:hypothetical protein
VTEVKKSPSEGSNDIGDREEEEEEDSIELENPMFNI